MRLSVKRLIRTYVSVIKLLLTVVSIVFTLIMLESMLNMYVTMKLQTEYQHVMDREVHPRPQNPTTMQIKTEALAKRDVHEKCPKNTDTKPELSMYDLNSYLNAKNRAKRATKVNGVLLALFTTFTRSKVRETVYNNTKLNWRSLSKNIKCILFTNDVSLKKEFGMAGWTIFPMQKVSKYGLPLVKYMYLFVRSKIKAKFYAFSNGDIIFTEDLVDTVESVSWYSLPGHIYITGQRTDTWNVTRREGTLMSELKAAATKRGELHIPFAEDYFITDEAFPWQRIPDLSIARQYYDNWMSYNARKNKYWNIDATRTILAVHQQVDRGSFEKYILDDNSNRFYNYYLILNMTRGHEPNFESGLTTCLDYYSARTILNETVIAKRHLKPGYCDVNGKRPKRIKQY